MTSVCPTRRWSSFAARKASPGRSPLLRESSLNYWPWAVLLGLCVPRALRNFNCPPLYFREESKEVDGSLDRWRESISHSIHSAKQGGGVVHSDSPIRFISRRIYCAFRVPSSRILFWPWWRRHRRKNTRHFKDSVQVTFSSSFSLLFLNRIFNETPVDPDAWLYALFAYMHKISLIYYVYLFDVVPSTLNKTPVGTDLFFFGVIILVSVVPIRWLDDSHRPPPPLHRHPKWPTVMIAINYLWCGKQRATRRSTSDSYPPPSCLVPTRIEIEIIFIVALVHMGWVHNFSSKWPSWTCHSNFKMIFLNQRHRHVLTLSFLRNGLDLARFRSSMLSFVNITRQYWMKILIYWYVL